ncbi:MAG: HAD family hydrolase [Acidobacteria bacterium]|nr:HAD family hydrolase [Acidobacteriota bacterium]
MIEVIAFDADDTLWHNERHYTEAKEIFTKILARYHDERWIEEKLDSTELQNLNRYGYGIKSFALSMIETAIHLTEGRITGNEIQEVIAIAWDMLRKPMEIFDGVRDTISALAETYKVLLITKGDLFEQEAKIARSGIGEYFSSIEIVSEKTPQSYQAILNKHQVQPQNFVMVGNSLKSDILPVLAIGGIGIYIPFETTWVHELVPEEELADKDFIRLASISHVPVMLASLTSPVS